MDTISVCTIDQLENLAQQFAFELLNSSKPVSILLYGVVGSGKSVFSRAFIRSYFQNPTLPVPSPTFTLVQIYTAFNQLYDIWHFDLYRIHDETEYDEIGLYEAMAQHVCLIEWPEKIDCPQNHLIRVRINIASETTRKVLIER